MRTDRPLLPTLLILALTGTASARAPRLVAQTGHGGGASSVSCSRDDRLVVTPGLGGGIRIREAETGRLLRVFSTSGGMFASLSPDGRTALASGGTDVRILDVVTGATTCERSDVSGTSRSSARAGRRRSKRSSISSTRALGRVPAAHGPGPEGRPAPFAAIRRGATVS